LRGPTTCERQFDVGSLLLGALFDLLALVPRSVVDLSNRSADRPDSARR